MPLVITVLAGGVGAAKFLAGLQRAVDPATVTAIVNVADDFTLHGLAISPDLDTVMYTLANAVNPETGWGLAGESWSTMDQLGKLGGVTWFRLGDKDLATHLFRTQRRSDGASLTAITAELCCAFGVAVRLLPVSNDPLATMVALAPDDREVDFQDYFVRQQHNVAVSGVRFAGAEHSTPGPGVIDAIVEAGIVVVAPSNPIVSIGPVLAVPGVRAALQAARARTVGISPIIGGAALKGPADRMLRELGHEVSVVGVARLYRDLVSVLVIDEVDRPLADAVRAEGVRCVVAPTIMKDPTTATALAHLVLEASHHV